jgi:hypothetical protein
MQNYVEFLNHYQLQLRRDLFFIIYPLFFGVLIGNHVKQGKTVYIIFISIIFIRTA